MCAWRITWGNYWLSEGEPWPFNFHWRLSCGFGEARNRTAKRCCGKRASVWHAAIRTLPTSTRKFCRSAAGNSNGYPPARPPPSCNLTCSVALPWPSVAATWNKNWMRRNRYAGYAQKPGRSPGASGKSSRACAKSSSPLTSCKCAGWNSGSSTMHFSYGGSSCGALTVSERMVALRIRLNSEIHEPCIQRLPMD